MDLLPSFGAIPVNQRVVHDGQLITGGGVTAGIDFGLYVAAQLAGPDVAQAIQLGLEYNPAPPFDAGHPTRARPEIVKLVEMVTAQHRQQRWDAVRRVEHKLAKEARPC
jgi:cyclohexyl-isocyanide hydratase